MTMHFAFSAAELRTRGIEAMAGLSSSLERLRALLDNLSSQFNALIALGANPVQPGDLDRVQQVAARICTHLERLGGPEAHDAMARESGRAFEALLELERQIKKFRLIASLTAIRVAETKAQRMSEFVEELYQVPARIQGALGEVHRAVQGLKAGQTTAQRTASQAASVLRQAQKGFVRATAPMAEILPKAQSSRARVKSGASTFVEQAHGETLKLISAFQFSDFLAQRLDHVVTMLERTEESAFGAIETLAAAQISGLVKDGQDVARNLRGALMRLERAARSAGSLFQGEGRVTKDLFAAQHLALQQLQNARDRARPAIETSTATAKEMITQVTNAGASLHTLLDISAVIDLAAVNARVKTARTGDAQASFAVLSSSVLETARGCRLVIDECNDAISRIAAAHGEVVATELIDSVAELEAEIARCADNLAGAQAADTSLTQAETEVAFAVDALQDLLGLCLPALDHFDTVLTDLAAIGAELARRKSGPIQDSPELEDIYALYTMSAEREIHDRLLGRPPRDQVPSASVSVDLADIFF